MFSRIAQEMAAGTLRSDEILYRGKLIADMDEAELRRAVLQLIHANAELELTQATPAERVARLRPTY